MADPTMHDATAQKTSHLPLHVRLERQLNALLGLSRRWRMYETNLPAALKAVTETAAMALDVERCSIWFYDEGRDAIVCRDLYELSKHRHSRGLMLAADDYPSYFNALESEEVIAAHDARTDPRTREFTQTYLGPLGIGAILDTPIRIGGELVGVLCNEHVGAARQFLADEQNTATHLANMVSLALVFQQRGEAERHAERSLSLLRTAFEASGAAMLAVAEGGEVTVYNERMLDLWQLTPELMGGEGDSGRRLEHMASQARDPDEFIARTRAVDIDPELESLDIIEMADGRVIECTSQPQRHDRRVLGRVWSYRDISYQTRMDAALEATQAELRELSTRDALTGLYTRRRICRLLEQEILRAKRIKAPLSVIAMVVDRPDEPVLRAVGQAVAGRLRATDSAGRSADGQLLLVVPGTGLKAARRLAKELCAAVEHSRDDLPSFTVSAGAAEWQDGQTADRLADDADAAVRDKHQGT